MNAPYEWKEPDEVEQLVFTITCEQLGVKQSELTLQTRLIEDLGCDSLDAIELLMELEDEFSLTVDEDDSDAIGKAIFTRSPMRVGDLVEFAVVRQGTGAPTRSSRSRRSSNATGNAAPAKAPQFSQLGGTWRQDDTTSLWEQLYTTDSLRTLRRRSDGMCCVQIPEAVAAVGTSGDSAQADELPRHSVQLDSYVIDIEPVSVSAFVRFLNSTLMHADAPLISLPDGDKRAINLQFYFNGAIWRARAETHRQPVVLVTWQAAKAYSIWAHGGDWSHADSLTGFLPTEAQWEHAAQGAYTPGTIQAGVHSRGEKYESGRMSISDVNLPIGVSVFGVRHMSGTVVNGG